METTGRREIGSCATSCTSASLKSSAMDQAMPGKPALIAVLLVERPTCLDCISQKAGVSTIEADRCLTVIGTALELWRSHDRCQTCGQKRAVYSLIRSSN